ncbi:acyl carrier protein [Candidatus Uabimicrobium amorphum]|uniref:Acyl carrier protein n=1 Tax=Uabimicrobium amorphum TaxID=2596890 RepID=A0A5S9IQK6_UABAM|nr:phosphopantetheine-binding protein [Candidatus Uabimicrobium amorphum]BBM85826.1 acyl carrier protein [Candidatus Uabimicrobium amorphum]
MDKSEIKKAVFEALCDIAPEVEPEEVDSQESLREELDIDSMDFLNFAIKLHEIFSVEIPESSYDEIDTIDGCVNYIHKHIQ